MSWFTQSRRYWISLGLFAFAMTASGIFDLLQPAELMAGLANLGYPAYLAIVLGVWKLAGVVAIVAPGLPTLKEWAYAGFVFDLSGASISHLVVGDPAANVVTPLVLMTVGLLSWWWRPASRRAVSPAPSSRSDALSGRVSPA